VAERVCRPPFPAALVCRGTVRLLSSATNLQTKQVKNKDTGNKACQTKKRPHQPVGKGTLGRQAPVHFERLFVNRRAGLIFDPSVVSLGSLVFDNLKRLFRVVGFC